MRYPQRPEENVAQRSEFAIEGAYTYETRGPVRWLLSHVRRYWFLAAAFYICFTIGWSSYSFAQVLIGRAADEIINPTSPGGLLFIALSIMGVFALDGLMGLSGSLSAETLAARMEADARQELYESLLGKSKQFHDRQRAGDIMARATDDTNQIANLIVPGMLLASETFLGLAVPITFIALTYPALAIVPLLFVVAYYFTARRYLRRLDPVISEQRDQFGRMNASLEETISGIEVVKASARENFEREKFRRNARLFRDFFVRQGYIEARYLPLLIYGFAVGLTFLHAIWLYRQGAISIGQVITVIGLVNVLRFPTFISIFAFSVVQAGMAGARRILRIISVENDMDENQRGHTAAMHGEIVFEDVSFGYERENPEPRTRNPEPGTDDHDDPNDELGNRTRTPV
ncbi:MAG: ABC transporter ATP-binding protein, partial [Oscillochloris sp.]|nr:ABC transporter ATP-binding protein [Oscillochloris sp.]